MTRVVIDTNVLVVANKLTPEADSDCETRAAITLQDTLQRKIIVIDTEQLAIREYAPYCSRAGQPGAADFFFKTLLDNIANPERVLRIDIGLIQEEIDSIIPTRLLDFDSDDRKWIALYLEGSAESIINAVDSDWAARKADLDGEGINVIELCPQCLNERRTGVVSKTKR
jgi:hypothetical protein